MNRQMSVSQLSRYLKGVFEDEELLHDVTLSGEVTDISYSDRHTFIVLSEGAYSVRCVHFSSRDNIEKGAKIALRGSVAFYDKRNSVSFTYTEFFTQGVGDKNARLTALKQKLCALGYFENRPQLPKYMTDVVVVTSPDGAAIRDFMRVVYDKNPFVGIRVYPVKVQGDGAAAQMTDAVNKLQSCKTDAIVLCRGGGSEEDLDSFNDEGLAVAVANSKIPIISAVGHEINFSLCDYCAGTRAGTPSIAGEIVNAHASKILIDLFQAIQAIKNGVACRYEREVMRLNRLGTSTTAAVSERVNNGYSSLRLACNKGLYAVQSKLNGKVYRLNGGALRLRSAAKAKTTFYSTKIEKLTALLNALDPHRIIKIGYAAVVRDGRRIMTAAQLDQNDEVRMVFSDGIATARVEHITRANGQKENHG